MNDLIDSKLGKGTPPFILRKLMKEKCLKRLNDFFKNSELKIPENIDVDQVEIFYAGLDYSKLHEVQHSKGSSSLYPEENDVIILAETIELLKQNPITLISGDKHFSYFKFEISDTFNIEVLDFHDLNKFI